VQKYKLWDRICIFALEKLFTAKFQKGSHDYEYDQCRVGWLVPVSINLFAKSSLPI